MTAPHDPLPELPGLDPMRLMASLLRTGRYARGAALAQTLEGVDRDIALGWTAGWQGRKEEAQAHLLRAIEARPTSLEAHAGLLMHGLPEHPPSPPEVALIRRIQGEGLGAEALADLEPRLAAFGRDHLLYHTAARLRAGWRIASGDPALAAEALEILDGLLPTFDSFEVQLGRVEAARVAGRTNAAWVGLGEFVDELRNRQPPVNLIQRALRLASMLPDHPLKPGVRAQLQRALR